jgi:hypothetical protein
VGRSRLRRMRFAMGIQSYFCCLTASRLPGNGIVEGSSRSRWLHYAPARKVLRIRKCLIVSTRSVRRASGLLETGLSVNSPDRDPLGDGTYRKRDSSGCLHSAAKERPTAPQAVTHPTAKSGILINLRQIFAHSQLKDER